MGQRKRKINSEDIAINHFSRNWFFLNGLSLSCEYLVTTYKDSEAKETHNGSKFNAPNFYPFFRIIGHYGPNFIKSKPKFNNTKALFIDSQTATHHIDQNQVSHECS